jgi:hypothetical protein
MNSKANYTLEEYKILKSETKTFTEQSFRDFQIFVGILAIFFTLLGSSNKGEEYLSRFASYALMQIAIFIFLLIQYTRVSYLLIVRKHLAELEEILNSELADSVTENKNEIISYQKPKLRFRWESEIVPSEISHLKTFITHNQVGIVIVYLFIYGILGYKSFKWIRQLEFPHVYYTLLFILESLFLVYGIIRLYYQHRITKREMVNAK